MTDRDTLLALVDDLLPCPFCGCYGLSLAWPVARTRMVAVIECHTDDCYATIEADTPRKAITAWNRRARATTEQHHAD